MVTRQHPGWGVDPGILFVVSCLEVTLCQIHHRKAIARPSNMMVWKGGGSPSTMEMIDVRANLRGIHVFFSFFL